MMFKERIDLSRRAVLWMYAMRLRKYAVGNEMRIASMRWKATMALYAIVDTKGPCTLSDVPA